MASGTAKVYLNPTTPIRFDDGAVFVSGEVYGTGVMIWYRPDTSPPPALYTGKSFDNKDPFTYEMGAGESLWATGPEFTFLEVQRRQV